MLPPWPSPLRHSHPCLSPTCYTRSAVEGGFEFLRPSVRGTPTTHSEGLMLLLLRVGALPCAPTYKTVAWYSTRSSIVWGLHRHTNAARRPQRAMQTVLLCKRPPTASKNLYRGRHCCTSHTAKARYYIYFLGTRLRLPRPVTLERVPTDWYFLFSACGVDMLPPRPSPLQLDIKWEF